MVVACFGRNQLLFYSIHIANYLSSCEEWCGLSLMFLSWTLKCTAKLQEKSYIGLGKNLIPIDAFVIADYARAGNIGIRALMRQPVSLFFETSPHGIVFTLLNAWPGRKLLSYPPIFIWNSANCRCLKEDDQPFYDIYGATSSSVIMEYLSPEEIFSFFRRRSDCIPFAEKAATALRDISKTADLLKETPLEIRYRLIKLLYELL